jgi:hypothetical protein
MEINNIKKVLKDNVVMLEAALKDGIINKGIINTGKLGRSVQVKPAQERDDNQAGFSISMEDYGFYQDSGVMGTKQKFSPNPESLFNPGQFKKKTIGGPLPFAVRKSIAEKGFRPRPFIVPAVKRLLQNLEPELVEAGGEDINEEIKDLFKMNGATV